MAMATQLPPVRTPTITPEVVTNESWDSPYNSRSVVILVGKEMKSFSVHEALLAQTDFFKIESLIPANEECPATDRSSLQVKQEDGSLMTVPTHGSYRLEDRFFFKPNAFSIFVKHLYGNSLTVPDNKSEERTMFRAYGIARKYGCFELQNSIIDHLRQYYARTTISLDDLVWAVNRYGDNTDCALNAYLVEQIAYEISQQGLPSFAKDNEFMGSFLEKGDRAIRTPLVEAIARLADSDGTADPATGKRNFHVCEKGLSAGRLIG